MKLLLLHPLPLDGSIFSDDLHALTDGSFAPTLYEVGDDLRAWARAALDAAGEGPVVVVGNSIGGSCAIEVARLAPRKVKALVLCGAKPGHRPDPTLRDEALHVLASDGLRAAWERYWLLLFGPAASPEVLQRGWASALWQDAEAVSSGVRAFHARPDRGAFLASWPGPVWLVSGEHDIRPERSRHLASRLPRGTFQLVMGAGHYVPLEAPRELAAITAEALAAVT